MERDARCWVHSLQMWKCRCGKGSRPQLGTDLFQAQVCWWRCCWALPVGWPSSPPAQRRGEHSPASSSTNAPKHISGRRVCFYEQLFCQKMVTVGRGRRRQLGEIICSPGTWASGRECLSAASVCWGRPRDRRASLPPRSSSTARTAGKRFRNEIIICIKQFCILQKWNYIA